MPASQVFMMTERSVTHCVLGTWLTLSMFIVPTVGPRNSSLITAGPFSFHL